jgi:hypothetical protein
MPSALQGYYRHFPANNSFFHGSELFQPNGFQLSHSSELAADFSTAHSSHELFPHSRSNQGPDRLSDVMYIADDLLRLVLGRNSAGNHSLPHIILFQPSCT